MFKSSICGGKGGQLKKFVISRIFVGYYFCLTLLTHRPKFLEIIVFIIIFGPRTTVTIGPQCDPKFGETSSVCRIEGAQGKGLDLELFKPEA
jgi:hypothetical protein